MWLHLLKKSSTNAEITCRNQDGVKLNKTRRKLKQNQTTRQWKFILYWIFFQIYMINLLRRPLRRERMYKAFRILGIEAKTVNAVDGK